MKKIKLFVPLISLMLTSTPMVIVTGCSKDDTKRVHVKYNQPEIANDFIIKYSLDKGYCLDLVNSTITFADQKPITLNECTIDQENKTIVVDKSLVVLNEVNVDIKSAKICKLSDDELNNSFGNLFFNLNANFTFSGDTNTLINENDNLEIKSTYDTPNTMSTLKIANKNFKSEYQMYKINTSTNWKKIEKWNIAAADFGRWTGNQSNWDPENLFPFPDYLNLKTNNVSDFTKLLKFNENDGSYILEKREINLDYNKHEITNKFIFNNNKLKYWLLIDEWKVTNKKYHSTTTYKYSDEGSTVLSNVPDTSSITSSKESKDNEFKYEQKGDTLKYDRLFSSKGNGKANVCLSKFCSYDESKYLYIKNDSFKWSSGNFVLYKNDELVGKGQYEFEVIYGTEYVKINPGVFTKDDTLKYIASQANTSTGVEIAQDVE